LVTQLHRLRTWDSGYAAVYTRLAHRFPNATRDIPKSEYQRNGTPSTSFFQQAAPAYSYQTTTVPPPPPVPPTSYAYSAAPQPQAPPPTQQWAARAPEPAPAVPSATGGTSSFFQPRQHMEGCSFCLQPDHCICLCPIAMDYVHSGCATVIEDKICLPNRQRIPNDRTGRGLKASIDQWLTSQNPPTPTQAHVVYAPSPPPPPPDQRAPPARIEEIAETNILQIAQVTQVQTQGQEQYEDENLDIFQVFAAEKKKRESKATKVLELANPPPAEPADATATPTTRPTPQY
jgi:hypothetical protein